ncbi:MAG: hypothetical protein IT204_06180 [Fimbriimonadaceae bacterium]|nr:hypothetical protein [Fimbriimonadaceae bacterium]
MLYAGWARVDLTPPLGSPLRGYFSTRLARAVHDPLQAKALYLQDGPEALAVVALDLCAGDPQLTAAARAAVAAAGDVPPERLVLHATHTHLGPYAAHHLEPLTAAVARAVALARRRAEPVRARGGHGREEGLSFCRRYEMADGSIRTNPGVRNPQIVRPTAPIDPTVTALELQHASGERLVILNFALHCDTIGGSRISADYPHFVAQRLLASHGPGTELLFLQGCCGDINHIDVTRADQPRGFAMARQIGAVLAGEVDRILARSRRCELAPLRVARRLVPFAVTPPDAAEVAAAREWLANAPAGTLPQTVAAHRTLLLAARAPEIAAEVFVAGCGEVALVALPGELFSAFGRQLREASPAPVTLVAELCHDDLKYLPTTAAAAGGAYENWNSLLPSGAGERLTAEATELLRALQV